MRLAANWLLAMYALFLLICWPRHAVSNVSAFVSSAAVAELSAKGRALAFVAPVVVVVVVVSHMRLSSDWLRAQCYMALYIASVCVCVCLCSCVCVCAGACVNLWNMLAALCNFSPCIFTFLTVTSCGSLALYTRCCTSVPVCVSGVVWWFFYYYFYNFCWLFFCVLLMCLFNRKFTNTSALGL